MIFDSICLNKNFKNVQKGAKFMGRMSRGKTNFLAKIVVQVIKAFQTSTVRLGYRRYA